MTANTRHAELIRLKKKTKALVIHFSDGQQLTLPFELLRVYSPSAETQGHGPGQAEFLAGKKHVLIERIEPVGHYAVKLIFSDGHDSGLYTWSYLYQLGEQRDALWAAYLEQLDQMGVQRK